MNIQGSLVALITPMDENGEVDYKNLAALLEHHIINGTHGIVSVGTTGESATLTVEEHLAVIEFTIKTVDGRIPVIAGTGGNSTREAIHLTTKAHELKADAALLVVPYYNKPNQEGMFQHFKAIAEEVPIAQVLYNVPGRTVADMSNETVNRLADIENVVAIKDATGDVNRGKKLIDLCADRISVLSGDDPTALELMKMGGVGNISVTANVAPKEMSRLCEAALAKDYQLAEQIDNKLRALHSNLFVESNPIPVKYAVSKQGFTSNTLRLPLTSLSTEFESILDDAMSVLN